LCGILGFTHRNHRVSPDLVFQALELLKHRGPDQHGYFTSEIATLGATRLKILDMRAGDQPMIAEGGDTAIVFNGEIYNHLEVRRELESLGFKFRTQTDTETVLYAFLAWDVHCFSRLRGMFAVAFWTNSERRLVLARDRVGIKPLYLAHDNGDLYFASEMKAILIHPHIKRNLNVAALDVYLSLNYQAGSQTLIEGIEKLAPGTWLEWRNGTVNSQCYWSVLKEQRPITLRSATEELDWLLESAVQEHLLSDVPLGVWLSGGVDSTTILHYAARASRRRLQSFSISFRGHSFDESKYIARAARAYNTEHHEIDLNTDNDLPNAIEEFAYYADEPNADAGALPVWFLSKLTRRTATVALSGEGADELFAGYLTYRADALARAFRRFPKSALRAARRAADLLPVSDEKIGFEYKAKRFLEGSALPEARAHVFWNGTFSEEEKLRLLRLPFTGTLNAVLGVPSPREDPLSSNLKFDQKYFLPDDILMKVDRMSMAHSVEVRPPFLDHRIIEFANSLPSRLKLSGSRQKVVLKALMRDKLPRGITRRKKTGFDIPAHQWMRGALRSLVTDTLRTGGRDYGDVFRPGEISRFLQLHLERRANYGYHLWGLMILFLWMKKWRIQMAGSRSVEPQLAQSGVPVSR
jgi:asparagine synthase (glutamine-hydrolysing)